jgi:nitroimidazol reductase NimA-like FMN-containing flavoprotein (pyridoxamine 5'-phosphate oxidase superfamily)
LPVSRDESWRGKVGQLERDELDGFLAEGHIARMACLDADGWPYVVPVWHEWDGRGFYVIPRMKSAWAHYLKGSPRCAITVDEASTLRKVIAQGEAQLLEEPNVGGRWVEIAERMSVRYLGANGPKYLEPTLDKKRWLFYIEPVRLWTWQGVDWARRYKTE